MSQHYHYPARAEFAKRLAAKPVPGGIKMAALGAAVVGIAVFIFGLFSNGH